MKILTKGTPPQDKPQKRNCNICDSLLEYTKEDIRHEEWNGSTYIICPVCQHRLAV
jgi:hypothetical protein